MTTNFPTTLDAYSDWATDDGVSIRIVNDIQDAVEALEAKVGKDGSAVTTSHDYKLQKNGRVISIAYAHTNSYSANTGLTVIGRDDTIPQNTEGVEVITKAYTAISASNYLLIEAMVHYAHPNTGGYTGAIAIFQDTNADAIAASSRLLDDPPYTQQYYVYHYMQAPDTSSHTYKVRVGMHAGTQTAYINGTSTGGPGRVFGGTLYSHIIIRELNP